MTQVRKASPLPVRYVLNSRHHADRRRRRQRVEFLTTIDNLLKIDFDTMIPVTAR